MNYPVFFFSSCTHFLDNFYIQVNHLSTYALKLITTAQHSPNKMYPTVCYNLSTCVHDNHLRFNVSKSLLSPAPCSFLDFETHVCQIFSISAIAITIHPGSQAKVSYNAHPIL